MKYILQIFSGSWHTLNHEPEDIIQRIEKVSARIPVDKVIIGWNLDASVYQKVGAFLREKGIRMILWLPVFSEVSAVAEPDEALDIFGEKIITPIHQEGEDFVFGCPSSPRNVQIVKEIYEKHFADCGFDGVFLDKIRSQSFVSGVSGVLSCGCERCRQVFRQKGVDLEAVRQQYEEKKSAFFDMEAYPLSGTFVLKNAVAQRFFEAKEEIIADAVVGLSQYFKDQGMIVGLDLFAPIVSRFVGQNYKKITRAADFIKPMLYRKTEAPAGIGYEYALFGKSAPNAQGRPEICMDKAFLDTQLEAVRQVDCEKFPGIEINYREDIARTNVEYVKESVEAIRSFGFEGAALCWNLMLAPEAHIDAIS